MPLSVPKNKTSFVESLIGGKGHFQVISNSHQQNPSFRQINSSLSNDLIEKFIV